MAGNDIAPARQARRAVLARATRQALLERARVLRIRGCSGMSKGELAEAVLQRVDSDDGLADRFRRVTPAR